MQQINYSNNLFSKCFYASTSNSKELLGNYLQNIYKSSIQKLSFNSMYYMKYKNVTPGEIYKYEVR